MNLNYEIVFIAEVLNDYFAGKECTDLDIFAADDTAAILKGQRMLCKTIGNKFIVLNKIDDTGKPFIAMDKTVRLRFFIAINNTDFSNYTNINYQPVTPAKYYFTNLNQTKIGPALYLNKTIAE